jgi:hypothetical protein
MATKTKGKTKPKPAKKSGPGHERMKARLGPKKAEALRQSVVADQARARSEVQPTAAPPHPAKKEKPTKEADARKITVLATANPHKAGSRRAKWFAKLKTGMTVADAVKEGVRATYITRMAARKIVKLG